MCASNASCVYGFLICDLVRLSASTTGCGIRKKLHVAGFVKQIKPINSFFDSLSNGQQAMIPEQAGLLLAKRISNIASFVLG